MRRILIDPVLKQIVADFNTTLFAKRDPKKFEPPLSRLARMKTLAANFPRIYGHTAAQMVAYITKIENEYLDILNADEAKMAKLIKEFATIITDKPLTKKFWSSIVCCMGYEDLRDNEFLSILDKLQIRTCVYCNSQLTLTIRKAFYQNNLPKRGIVKGEVRVWKGLLQLDHRHAKSLYPFLSASFFNLYPSCSNCNQAKSDDPCDFILYNDGTELDAFKFKLADRAVINYWDSNDKEDLIVEVNHVKPKSNEAFAEAYEKTFSIAKIYNTQKDIVEELLHKAKVYTDDYNKALMNSFGQLFPDQAMLNRLIIGNYDRPEDIHKRPMAKFMQEIARDIKLIK